MEASLALKDMALMDLLRNHQVEKSRTLYSLYWNTFPVVSYLIFAKLAEAWVKMEEDFSLTK